VLLQSLALPPCANTMMAPMRSCLAMTSQENKVALNHLAISKIL
jgi:hypothetical protein